MTGIKVFLAALLVLGAAGPLLAEEAVPAESGAWPQYRGPGRDGVAPRGIAWSEAGARLAWRTGIGPSFAGVAVRDGRLYTGTSDESHDFLAAYDAATGNEVWKIEIGEVFPSEFGNGPRATPTLDGETVYFLGGKGRLVAARAATGEIVWQADLVERFGAEIPRFGYSGSALVLGDLLLLEVGGKEGKSLVWFDKATGETKRTVQDGPAGYSSPIVVTLGGVPQVVLVRGRALQGLDEDGETLWSRPLEGGVVAMPVPVGDDRLFVSAGDDTGCVLLRVTKSAEGAFAVEEVWKNRNMRNHFNSSVVVGSTIYGFDNATLKALDVDSGEMLWGKRGLGKGSLVAAGDLLAVLTDKGRLAFVRAGRDGYEELGSVDAIEGKSWTSPSVAGSRVYVRNHEQMACVEVGG